MITPFMYMKLPTGKDTWELRVVILKDDGIMAEGIKIIAIFGELFKNKIGAI